VCGLVGWKEWHSGRWPSLGRSVHGFGRLGMEIFPARLTGWLHAWPDACLDSSCKTPMTRFFNGTRISCQICS
jgi:hypothetical protein